MENRDGLIYDPETINWEARKRVDMLSVRPSPPDRFDGPISRKSTLSGALFCFGMGAVLAITWGLFL